MDLEQQIFKNSVLINLSTEMTEVFGYYFEIKHQREILREENLI